MSEEEREHEDPRPPLLRRSLTQPVALPVPNRSAEASASTTSRTPSCTPNAGYPGFPHDPVSNRSIWTPTSAATLGSSMLLGEDETPPEPLELRRGATAPTERRVRERQNVVLGLDRPCEAVDSWVAKRQSVVMTDTDRDHVRRQVMLAPVCALLDGSLVDSILDNMICFGFSAGEVLCKQGDLGLRFCVVRSGTLDVILDDDAKPVNSMRDGHCFGASALLLATHKTVSIVAREDSTVWGIDGVTFRAVLAKNKQNRQENMVSLLDSMDIFAGLSADQKTRVVERALQTKTCEAGEVIVEEGRDFPYVGFVKSGKLQKYKGARIEPDGHISGGTPGVELVSGDSFGRRAAYQFDYAKCRSTIVTVTRCELVCMCVASLRSALGDNLPEALEKHIVFTCMDQSALSQFSLVQKRYLLDSFEFKSVAPNELITKHTEFIVCLGGQVYRPSSSSDCFLERGAFAESEALLPKCRSEDTPMVKQVSERVLRARSHSRGLADDELCDLTAGPTGARCALLSAEKLSETLDQLGIQASSVEDVQDAKKRLLARKVPIFHHLTSAEIDNIAESFIKVHLKKNDHLFEAGKKAADFFIVISGEVAEVGTERKVGKNGHIGERALLLQILRRYTVRVVSDHAELWQLEAETFEQFVTGEVREGLRERMVLRDTAVDLADLETKRIIGRGSFGSVQLVKHRRTDPPLRYAFKRVKKTSVEQDKYLVSECALLAEIDHPLVVQLVKTFETRRHFCILTELLTGGDLFYALDQIQRSLTRSEAQFYVGSLVLVLDFLHDRHIVYRDLKPENVMLDAQGYVKLIDFGTAKKLLSKSVRTYTLVGSYHFMAPEIPKQPRVGYGTEVDIWSLGIMLYEMVCGFLPFARDVPAVQENWLEICTRVRKDNLRFPESYGDKAGKCFLRVLLRKDPVNRLGVGQHGFEDICRHEFFDLDSNAAFKHPGATVFDLILRRQLDPPYVPGTHIHAEDEDMADMSDDSELGVLLDDHSEAVRRVGSH